MTDDSLRFSFFHVVLLVSLLVVALLFLFVSNYSNSRVEELVEGVVIDGSVDVYVQDQTTFPFDIYAHTFVNTTSLVVETVTDSRNVVVSDSTGATVGMAIDIVNDDSFFQSLITAVDGNNITLASPIDCCFEVGSVVSFGDWDFSGVDGSVSPKSFYVRIPTNKDYDFYTMTLNIEDNNVMYDSTFGGLSALSNGFIGRAIDGISKTFFVITNNGGFRENGFTVLYNDKVPSGTYSFSAVKNIREVNGVALRLNGEQEEYLEFIVQDDLTGLSKMAVAVHGHEVED